jgi:hypothetical protein
MKTFAPTSSKMTKDGIAEYINEECDVHEVKCNLTSDDLSDETCQYFVDELGEALEDRDLDDVDLAWIRLTLIIKVLSICGYSNVVNRLNSVP